MDVWYGGINVWYLSPGLVLQNEENWQANNVQHETHKQYTNNNRRVPTGENLKGSGWLKDFFTEVGSDEQN